MSPILLLLLLVARLTQSQRWGAWPLYTPLLGEISPQCREASLEYVLSYTSAVQTLARGDSLTERERTALAMFDSNGDSLPFLQEGHLADVLPLDLCDLLLPEVAANEGCKEAAPAFLRTVRIPFGSATSPGTEPLCREAEAKYCYNYFQAFPPASSTPASSTSASSTRASSTPASSTPASLPLPLPTVSPRLDLVPTERLVNYSLASLGPLQAWRDTGLDPATSESFLADLLERSSRLRSLTSQISHFLEVSGLDQSAVLQSVVLQVVGLMLFVWGSVNRDMGVGEWGKQAPLPYQGMCYPAACSKLDIERNNLELYKLFSVPGLPMASASPIISDYLADLAGLPEETKKEYKETSVGCTDDYGGSWRGENYLMVTVLALIAVLTLSGTAADIYQTHQYIDKPVKDEAAQEPPGLASEMLRSFSLIQNMKFIFQKPSGSSQRLSCLEGMRSLSMTWVILGHHFAFGFRYLHAQNWNYIYNILGNHGGGVLVEAIMQGDYSVDTFMFIGATLASFLLLKDLDKSNGWFHGRGLIRMLLFYVNRYLRLTIPYALVMGVYIGIIPLVITEPIGAAQWVNMEAKLCRKTLGWHLTYSNIFYMHSNMCIGQTWYLSCEMICFLLSPLVIYPLWAGQQSRWTRLASVLWWCLVLGALLGLSVWYHLDPELYEQHAALPGSTPQLPPFQYSPWGLRGQSYIMGLMAGYVLYVSRDCEVKIDRKLNIIIWEVMAFTGLALVYGPYWMKGETYDFSYMYNVLHKVAWSTALSWVTFACSRGYGGIVNDFLSWGFWLPISKISFMTYLLHMSANWYFFLAQPYNMDYSMWQVSKAHFCKFNIFSWKNNKLDKIFQVTEWFVPQVWLCLLAGLLGSLTLELPFGKIQKLLIQKLLDVKTR